MSTLDDILRKSDWLTWAECQWQEALRSLQPEELRQLLKRLADERQDWLRQLKQRLFPSNHPARQRLHLAGLQLLSHLNSSHEPMVDMLLEFHALYQEDLVLASPLVTSLGRMTGQAEKILPCLFAELENLGTRQRPSPLIEAIVQLAGERPGDWIARAARGLEQSPEATGRHGCASLLDRWGPAAEPALPALLQATQTADEELRSRVALALGHFSKRDEVAKRLLRLTEEDQPWFVRGNAIESAAYSGRPEVLAAALSVLQEDPDTPDWSAPECALRALGTLGLAAALPHLGQVISSHKDPRLVRAALNSALQLASPLELEELLKTALNRSEGWESWAVALRALEHFAELPPWCAPCLERIFERRDQCDEATLQAWLAIRGRLTTPMRPAELRWVASLS